VYNQEKGDLLMSTFFIPSVNEIGKGCLADAVQGIKSLGFKNILIVTDAVLVSVGVVKTVTDKLEAVGLKTAVYDGTKPNPTTQNILNGLKSLKEHGSDLIITLGGGSSHDCGKGIALVAANGGKIQDYEGVNMSKKPQFPLIAINTTAGTGSEMTRFCIITDEARQIKMAIVDKHATPLMSINDPDLMMKKPASLTAATGMDALTHAVEAYVSTIATPLTDALAIKAIEMVQATLRTVVKDGSNEKARENMAYAQFMAGCAFNNASLGYVHAMAHQLGGLLDLPHGICNAVLLPYVEEYNAPVVAGRLKDVAKAMGVDVSKMSDKEGAKAAIEAIRTLSRDVGTSKTLTELGVKDEHIETMATNALKDACGATNPKVATFEEICAIYRAAM